jgi:hypothetical protein
MMWQRNLKEKKQNRFFVDDENNVNSFERRHKLNLVKNSILGEEVSNTISFFFTILPFLSSKYSNIHYIC